MILTEKNYFSDEANRHYMSVSTFKAIMNCGATWDKKINKEVFLEGHFMEECLYGNLDKFVLENDGVKQKNKDILLKKYSDYIIQSEIIKKDKNFMSFLTGNNIENEKIFTGELFGVPWKIKVDSINLKTGIITDLKFVKNFENKWNAKERIYVSWLEHWRYDVQMAVYQEIVRQNTGKTFTCIIAGVTKEKIADHNLYKFDQESLKLALEYVSNNIERVVRVWTGQTQGEACGVCDICKSNKKINSVKDIKMWNQI